MPWPCKLLASAPALYSIQARFKRKLNDVNLLMGMECSNLTDRLHLSETVALNAQMAVGQLLTILHSSGERWKGLTELQARVNVTDWRA